MPRAQFDQVLADEAARRGATIRYEVEITAIDVSGERPVVTARAGDEISTHRPRFVLDASGFGRTLPRLLDLDRPSDFPERAALFVHVKDNIVSGEFDRQKIRIGVHPDEERRLVVADSVLERQLLARRGRLARTSREVHGHAPKNGCGS